MKAAQSHMGEDIRMLQEMLGLVSGRRCPREGAGPSPPPCPSPRHPAAVGVTQREGHREGRVGRVSQGGSSAHLPWSPPPSTCQLCLGRAEMGAAACRSGWW